jgi:molybdopterin molybdotransferase
MSSGSTTQRITQLTSLRAILALIETSVDPVKPRTSPVSAAFGHPLAEVVMAQSSLPAAPVALRDGFAVNAAVIADAGSYTPVPLVAPCKRIDMGGSLPDGTDAIVPFDAVNFGNGGAEAVAPIASGEGVLAAGGDANAGATWQQAGKTVRSIDVAILAAAGVAKVSTRTPFVRVVSATASRSRIIDASLGFVARAVTKAGGHLVDAREDKKSFEDALTDIESDVVIAVGGTGSGQHDTAVHTLARLGRVEAHGIAVSPGETATFGFAGGRPVLLIPGRLDAVLAIWLLIGRPLLAKLAGGAVEDVPVTLPLKRKVTSTIGLTELVPVGCGEGVAEPLGSGYLSLTSLARSDGWVVVPADSEGFAAGTPVAVHPWL